MTADKASHSFKAPPTLFPRLLPQCDSTLEGDTLPGGLLDFSGPKTTWKLTAHRQQRETVFLEWLRPVQEAGKDSQKLQEDQA